MISKRSDINSQLKRESFRVQIRKTYNKQLFEQKRQTLHKVIASQNPNEQIIFRDIQLIKKHPFNINTNNQILQTLQLLENTRLAKDQIFKYFRYLVQKRIQYPDIQYKSLLEKINAIMYRILQEVNIYQNFIQMIWPILKGQCFLICWMKIANTSVLGIKLTGYNLFRSEIIKYPELSTLQVNLIIEIFFCFIYLQPKLQFSSTYFSLSIFKSSLQNEKIYQIEQDSFNKILLCLIQLLKQDHQIQAVYQTENLINLIYSKVQQSNFQDPDIIINFLKFVTNLFKGNQQLSVNIFRSNRKIIQILNGYLQSKEKQIIRMTCFALGNLAANGPHIIHYFTLGKLMENIIATYIKGNDRIRHQILHIFYAIMCQGQPLQRIYLYEMNIIELIGGLMQNDNISTQNLNKCLRIIYQLLMGSLKSNQKDEYYTHSIITQLIFKFNIQKKLQRYLIHENSLISDSAEMILENFFNKKKTFSKQNSS